MKEAESFSLRGFPKGSLSICHCEGSRREPVAISLFTQNLSLRASRKGGVAISSLPTPSVIASPPKAGVAISSLKRQKYRLPRLNASCVQARNDKKDTKVCHCKTFLTKSRGNLPLCPCEPPAREAWQSLFLKNFLPRARLPLLNANAFRLAMTERGRVEIDGRLPRLNAKGVQARNDIRGARNRNEIATAFCGAEGPQ